MRQRVVILVLLLIALSTSVHAVELPVPVQRALALLGTIELPRVMSDLCVTRAPGSAKSTAEAYEAWRLRRRGLIEAASLLLEKHEDELAPLFKASTEGQITNLQGFAAFFDRMAAESAKAKGDEYIESMCKTFPDFIATVDKGFEDRLLSQSEALTASLRPSESTAR